MNADREAQVNSSDQVDALVRKLNMTYDDAFQWVNRKAQKEHTDLFGEAVKQGERYWRMRMGGAYSNDMKLSDASMRRFLFALFAPRPRWEKEVENDISKQAETIRRIMDEVLSKGRTEP